MKKNYFQHDNFIVLIPNLWFYINKFGKVKLYFLIPKCIQTIQFITLINYNIKDIRMYINGENLKHI